MKKVLLLGSNGLLAQSIVALAPSKTTIVGVSIESDNRIENLSRYIQFNLTEFSKLHSVIEQTSPDVIINTAAMTHVDACEDQKELASLINLELPRELAKTKIPLVHFSSDYVFDGKHGPYRESDATNPLGHYGQTKLDSEAPVLASHPNSIVIRTMLLWGLGQGDKVSFTEFVRSKLASGSPVQVVTDQMGNPTLVSDLALVVWKLLEKKVGGLFHVSGSERMSRYDWAQKVALFYGLSPSNIHPCLTSDLKQKAQRPLESGFILEKLQRTLGFIPGNLEEQLKSYQEQLAQVSLNQETLKEST